MCGRIAATTPPDALARAYPAVRKADLLEQFREPRYNLTPLAPLPAIRSGPDGAEWAALRWGLVPSWAKDDAGAARLINARAETAHEKPSFRSAFAQRRCLLPVSGFYEWQRSGGPPQPYYVYLRDGELMALAGLWERWRTPEGGFLETCAVLTTEANALMARIHDRMPVLIAPEEQEAWLCAPHAEALRPLLQPYPDDALAMHAVSPRMNRAGYDDPSCTAPAPATASLF